MTTAKLSYIDMSHEELLKLAAERGITDTSGYRKVDFQKLFKAMDDGADDVVQEVHRVARERSESVKSKAKSAGAQTATAARVMEMAKANHGVPMATKPKADVASVQAGASLNESAQIQKATEEAAAEEEKLDLVKGGSDLVAKIRERGQLRRQEPHQTAKTAATRAQHALQMARHTGQQEAAAAIKTYEVLQADAYYTRHGVYRLPKGAIISEKTHDIAAIKKRGTKLREIDPAKTELKFSELGNPVVTTAPLEAEASK